jgi:hypothetical protein
MIAVSAGAQLLAVPLYLLSERCNAEENTGASGGGFEPVFPAFFGEDACLVALPYQSYYME